MNQITDKDLLQIESYLLGEMSREEQTDFDQRLESDKVLQSELEMQKAIKTGLEAHGERRLKRIFRAEEAKIKNPQAQARRRNLNPWWAAAAAIALALGFWFWQQSSTPNLQQLYATNFDTYPNVVVPLERGTPAENLEEISFRAYEQGNFSQALSGLEELEDQQQNPEFQLYKAVSLMALLRADEAIPVLQNLTTENWRFIHPARWYLALAYLNTMQTDKAIPLLKQVASSSDFKQQEAANLLSDLGE